MGPNLYSRQFYGDLSLRAGTLPPLETIERFQFAAARILGLSGKLMGPVTGGEITHNLVMGANYAIYKRGNPRM